MHGPCQISFVDAKSIFPYYCGVQIAGFASFRLKLNRNGAKVLLMHHI